MVIARKPDRFLQLLEHGVKLDELNVGNMSQTEETQSLTKSINVTDTDIDVFKKLNDKGLKIVSQMVPNDEAVNFMSLLNK